MSTVILLFRLYLLSGKTNLNSFWFNVGRFHKNEWWAGPDSNRRPSARQADVLTRLDDRPYSHFRMFFSYLSFSLFSNLNLKGYNAEIWVLFSPITLNSFYVGLVCWAGRSAWNDRSVGIAEAAGSNPAPSTLLLFEKGFRN